MNSIILLILAHYVSDFGLQNDFIAKFKVPRSAPFWYHVMTAHCAIQAIGVYLITHSMPLTAADFASHFVIDYCKCRGWLSFNQDQALHIACRITWGFLLLLA